MGAATTALFGGVIAVGLVVVITILAGALIVLSIEAIAEYRDNREKQSEQSA